MLLFRALFPRIAAEETRYVTLTKGDDRPKGQFAYLEAYCAEKGCDGGNVLLSVVAESGERFATINYDIAGAQHRGLGVPRAFLDPLNPQSEFAAAFLELFEEVVLDDTYQERLERHLRLVKAKVGPADAPLQAGGARVATSAALAAAATSSSDVAAAWGVRRVRPRRKMRATPRRRARAPSPDP